MNLEQKISHVFNPLTNVNFVIGSQMFADFISHENGGKLLFIKILKFRRVEILKC